MRKVTLIILLSLVIVGVSLYKYADARRQCSEQIVYHPEKGQFQFKTTQGESIGGIVPAKGEYFTYEEYGEEFESRDAALNACLNAK